MNTEIIHHCNVYVFCMILSCLSQRCSIKLHFSEHSAQFFIILLLNNEIMQL